VNLLINTPVGRGARTDGWEIRRAAIEHGIPCITTMTGATAAARAIGARRAGRPEVHSLQELHGTWKAKGAGRRGSERPIMEPGRA
jgi:carbamoyl-phosphate synthase large subunit